MIRRSLPLSSILQCKCQPNRGTSYPLRTVHKSPSEESDYIHSVLSPFRCVAGSVNINIYMNKREKEKIPSTKLCPKIFQSPPIRDYSHCKINMEAKRKDFPAIPPKRRTIIYLREKKNHLRRSCLEILDFICYIQDLIN